MNVITVEASRQRIARMTRQSRAAANQATVRGMVAARGWIDNTERLAGAAVAVGFTTWYAVNRHIELASFRYSSQAELTKMLLGSNDARPGNAVRH